ncbi:hypothetical protein HHK36_026832 [Tetracentron sinense]|uniref:Uncharacterized protein n=1 Tax=Tetracentron sinense TaxID=13715 RepID=A0A834YJF0_TETSI|nr:hypothetical protein HHK36_026832 [Tetracentron sinense]
MEAVSPITEIINRLWDCIALRTDYIRELQENLHALRSLMDELVSVRSDVKRRVDIAEGQQLKPRDQVEVWLQMVESTEHEVDQIIEEGFQQISNTCLGGCCPKHCCSSYRVGKRVAKKLKMVAELRSKGDFNEVAYILPPAEVEVMPSRPTVGMDLMFENVWRCLREDEGHDIIGTLKLVCLLESGFDEDTHVKMHDVIRDLALWISCNCGRKQSKILVQARVGLTKVPEVEKWRETERISLIDNNIRALTETPICPNLLTLLLNDNRLLRGISDGFFKFMHTLRILDLSRTCIMELPMGIVELVELLCLNLSETPIKTLPNELKNLVKPQHLDLSYTDFLTKISVKVILGLPRLQVLNLYSSRYANWDMDGDGGANLGESECFKHLKDAGITIRTVSFLQKFFNFHNLSSYQILIPLRQLVKSSGWRIFFPLFILAAKEFESELKREPEPEIESPAEKLALVSEEEKQDVKVSVLYQKRRPMVNFLILSGVALLCRLTDLTFVTVTRSGTQPEESTFKKVRMEINRIPEKVLLLCDQKRKEVKVLNGYNSGFS